MNAVGASTSTVTDLYGIYQQACGGLCSGVEVTWAGFDAAAQVQFGPASPQYLRLSTSGNLFGVDETQFQ